MVDFPKMINSANSPTSCVGIDQNEKVMLPLLCSSYCSCSYFFWLPVMRSFFIHLARQNKKGMLKGT